MAHSELLRRPGELCKAVTSLQASSRSQDALLADLGQRVESSATAVDRQLRLAEVDMASLRSRVTVLEESLSDAVSEATRARTEVAALREFVQAPRFQVHAKQPWPLSRAGSLQSSPRRASPSRTCEVTAQPGPPSPEQRSDGNVEGRLCKLEASFERHRHSATAEDWHELAVQLRSDMTSAIHAAQALTTRSLTSMEERVFSFGEGHRALESQIAGMTSSILGCGHEQQRLAVEVAKLHDTAKQVQELLQDQSKTQELRRDVTEEQKLRKEATCHLGTKLEELRREISEEQRNRSEALSRVGTKLQEESRRDLAEEQKLRKEATSLLGAQLKEEFRRDLAEEQRLRKEAMEELAAQLEEESHRDLAEEQKQRKEALILLGTQLEDQLASMADRQQHQASELGKLSRELVSNALEATKRDLRLLREETVERQDRLDERLQLSQSRTAKEIGEQRARVEGRLLRLEETWQPAKMASSDVGSWLQSCILEVREAQETLEQTFESKFAGILRCLKALYMKVGLSAREALASLQDSHLELDDLWTR